MKKKVGKLSAAVFAVFIICSAMPCFVYASGSFYVSATSVSLEVGDSGGFSFGATDAVGFFSIDTDGGISASCSDDLFVDNSSVYISITANTIGTGHVYITVYDGTDYDENDLSGKSYTVTVNVTQPETGVYNGTADTEETTTVEKTTTQMETTTENVTTTQEEVTTEKETATTDPETALLTTEIDDAEMLVMKDASVITCPDYFTVEETEYNTVAVQTLVCDDIRLYILENTADGSVDYYILDEASGEFEALKYTEISGVGMCIFLEIPDGIEIPKGYSLVETEIFGCSVEALAVEGSGNEEEAETVTVITTAYSAVSDLTASSDGHYFVYCLLAGEKVLCDYDSEQNILQRCVSLPEIEASAEESETETHESQEYEEGLTDSEEGLTVIIIIIAAVIIIFAVINIIRLIKRR